MISGQIPPFSIDKSSSEISSKTPPFNLSIFREENLSMELVLEKISQLPSPQVFLWYIGSHGLKKGGTSFYQEMIKTILSFPNQSSCLLMDLTAWGALFNKNVTILKTNRCAKMINDFAMERVQCLFSSTFFQELQEVKDQKVADYFKAHLFTNESLKKSSQPFRKSGITIAELFDDHCSVLQPIFAKDASKSYSLLQYLEGYFLIKNAVKNALAKEGPIHIVFSLPNDESKYYFNEQNSFLTDCQFLLEQEFGSQLEGREVTINFYNFQFGERIDQRPYNDGKVLKRITNTDFIGLPV